MADVNMNGLQSGVPTVVEFEKCVSVDAVHALPVLINLEISMLRTGVVQQLFIIELFQRYHLQQRPELRGQFASCARSVTGILLP